MHIKLATLALILVAGFGCEEEATRGFGNIPDLPPTCSEDEDCPEGFECFSIPDVALGFCSCDEAVNNGVGVQVCEPPNTRGEGEPCSSDRNCAEGLVCRARDAVGTLGCVPPR